MPPSLRPPRDLDEATAFGYLAGWAFGSPEHDPCDWIDSAGIANFRLLVDDGALLGGALLVPMGQWFGGRSAPMTGLASVTVRPELRGRGVGRRLMREILAELSEANVALSTLCPSTDRFYQSMGYGRGGSRFRLRLPLRHLHVREGEARVRPFAETDRPRIEAAYRALARSENGLTDRGPYLWRRTTTVDGKGKRGFVVESEQGELEGYLILQQKPARGFLHDLIASDWVALTEDAGNALLSVLSAHQTFADALIWGGSASPHQVESLPDRSYSAELTDHWFTRVVDVASALEARGYPQRLAAELHLEVRDAVLAKNAGRFVLRAESGRGTVDRGGSGRLSIDVRGLASLYTGAASTALLARSGLLTGDAESRALADALFAGSAPWMVERF